MRNLKQETLARSGRGFLQNTIHKLTSGKASEHPPS